MSASQVVVKLTVNGVKISQEVDPNQMLADFLRENLNLTGTKVCCGIGICKACTVAYQDGTNREVKRAQACITPISSMQNCDLKTVEGLAKNKHLSSLQEAFLKHFSFQCGFSTPGFLMGAYILLSELENKPIHKNQIEEAILRVVGEHICRCTGYAKYHEAIREVILNTPGLLIADK